MIARVREAIRLDRLYDRLRRERADPVVHAVILLLKGAVWLGLPAFALFSAEAVFGHHRGYFFGCFLGVTLGWFLTHWAGTSAAKLDAFFPLRAPSRPAYRAARWIVRLPWFLYCGGVWAVAAGFVVDGPARTRAVVLAFFLPLLQGALSATYSALRARVSCSAMRIAGWAPAGLTIPGLIALFAFLPDVRTSLTIAVPFGVALLLARQLRLARTGEVSLPEEAFGEEEARDQPVSAFDFRLPSRHPGATGIPGAARAARRARRRVRAGPRAFPDVFRNLVYLLWYDLRGLHRGRLRSFLLSVALPGLAAGASAAILLSPTPERLALLGLLAATFLFRAGALGLWHYGARGLQRAVAVLALFWCGVWFVASPSFASGWTFLFVVAALGAAGVGIVLATDEGSFRARLRDSASPSRME